MNGKLNSTPFWCFDILEAIRSRRNIFFKSWSNSSELFLIGIIQDIVNRMLLESILDFGKCPKQTMMMMMEQWWLWCVFFIQKDLKHNWHQGGRIKNEDDYDIEYGDDNNCDDVEV